MVNGNRIMRTVQRASFFKKSGEMALRDTFSFCPGSNLSYIFYYNHQSVAVQLVNCRESLIHSRASFFALYDLFSPCEHLVIWFRTVPASYHILLHQQPQSGATCSSTQGASGWKGRLLSPFKKVGVVPLYKFCGCFPVEDRILRVSG